MIVTPGWMSQDTQSGFIRKFFISFATPKLSILIIELCH